jgi:predicted nucleic acid-binding protein
VIVLDASAAVEVILNLPRAAPHLRARLVRGGETVHVPHVFDLEVLAAFRRHSLRGALPDRRSRRALRALEELRATRYSHVPLRRRIWELRENVTPYDAAYIALAEALRAPLVTVDAALAGAAGARAVVELYPSP